MTPPWGSIELEPEVERWLLSLTAQEFGQAQFYFDLLEREGVHLGFPYTSQLEGKLRELRFFIDGTRWRVSYYVVSGRRIVMLTVFPKSRRREAHEVRRAAEAMRRCIQAGHTASEE